MNSMLKRTRSNIFLAKYIKKTHYIEHSLKSNAFQQTELPRYIIVFPFHLLLCDKKKEPPQSVI